MYIAQYIATFFAILLGGPLNSNEKLKSVAMTKRDVIGIYYKVSIKRLVLLKDLV